MGGGGEDEEAGREERATRLLFIVMLSSGVKSKFPGCLVLLRDVLSDWVPLGLHLSSLSSLTPLPHKMLERRREEAGEEGA